MKRCHSPLDRALASVTVAFRDPTARFSRDDCCVGRTSWRVRSRANERRKEKESARRNACGHFTDSVRNAKTERNTETGQAEIEVEKEGDADAHAETEGKENS